MNSKVVSSPRKNQGSLKDKFDLVFNTFIETTGLITTGTALSQIASPILKCSRDMLSGKASFILLLDKKWMKMIYQAQNQEGRVLELHQQEREILLEKTSKISTSPATMTLGELCLSALKPLKKYRSSTRMIVSKFTMAGLRGVLGVILSDHDVSKEDLKLFKLLSRKTAVAFSNAKQFEKTQMLSITDGLTGAYNYRFMIDAGKKEIGRADRFGEQFSLIMIDIDGLKDYNDVHGHLKGSGVIKQLAKLASKSIRKIDLLCKYGGDEFVVIQPRTSKAGAACAAERIRKAIMKHRFPGERATGKITASMGIATYPEDGKTVQKLIESADKALYKAKTHGRNQIWLAGRKRPYSKG